MTKISLITSNNCSTYTKCSEHINKQLSFKQGRDTFRRGQESCIDIKLRGKYPANILSNLSDTNMKLDGVKINSFEGFLQSLKTNDDKTQREFCLMNGLDAKKASKGLARSKRDIILYWGGNKFKNGSDDFKSLMHRANEARKKASGTFILDGIEVASMDGLLQALKVSDSNMQKKLCMLTSAEAKKASKNIKAKYAPRTLYWQGKYFSRDSKEYQRLLKRAYKARYKQDDAFRNALLSTGEKPLKHTIGKTDINETILTTDEFISNLQILRKNGQRFNILKFIKTIVSGK